MDKLFDDIVTNINKVIITDEDQAYRTCISKLKHKPVHILCSIHKYKNFIKYLRQSELDKDEKIQAKEYFSKICYSKNKELVEKLFSSLKLYKDGAFIKYVERLYEEKEYLSKSFISSCTLGYNTSSIAESMNKLIKIDTKGKKLTIQEFRKCFDKAHKRSSRNAIYNDSKILLPVNFPFPELKNYISKTSIKEQYIMIKKLFNYVSQEDYLSPGRFYIVSIKYSEQRNIVNIDENSITCTCNQNV